MAKFDFWGRWIERKKKRERERKRGNCKATAVK